MGQGSQGTNLNRPPPQQYLQNMQEQLGGYMNDEYAQRYGDEAIARAQKNKHGKKFMENEYLLKTQTRCCAPALNSIEDQVKHAP